MRNKKIGLILAASLLMLFSCSVANSSSGEAPSIRQDDSVSQISSAFGEGDVSSGNTASSMDASSSETSRPTSDQDDGSYKWAVDFDEFGLDFQNTLGSLINATRSKTASYSQCLSIGAQAAAYPNASSSTFIPFYHEAKDSEKGKTSECNREHTWPKSRGGNYIETDPIVIRPTFTSDNSDRANYFYGNTYSNEWDPAICDYEGARGESARVILYAVTCYHDQYGLNLSNNPGDSTGSKTMGTLATLLKWNREYRPSAFEKTVNERYAAMGYARNAFVDHPEYADYIYDDNGYRTSKYDEGGESSSISYTKTYYAQHTDLRDLDGRDFIIATPVASESDTYMSLTSTAKSEALPWYLNGFSATVEEGHLYQTVPPESFHFVSSGSGYQIKTFNNEFLFGYKAGSHYSIGIAQNEQVIQNQQGSTSISAISNVWDIQDKGNGEAVFHCESGVFLEFYRGSWCGFSSSPDVNISLFEPTPMTEVI